MLASELALVNQQQRLRLLDDRSLVRAFGSAVLQSANLLFGEHDGVLGGHESLPLPEKGKRLPRCACVDIKVTLYYFTLIKVQAIGFLEKLEVNLKLGRVLYGFLLP